MAHLRWLLLFHGRNHRVRYERHQWEAGLDIVSLAFSYCPDGVLTLLISPAMLWLVSVLSPLLSWS